ncbi:MAG: response regulator [Cyanothece sp. SIO2G6]|nr:response regulator [Cyanothece sp. SIO2G6]
MDIVKDSKAVPVYLHGNEGSSPRPLPQLVLLDLSLPKVDSITVLEQIQQHPRTQHLIVVVVTSSAADQDLLACYDLGVNSYIVKPLDFQRFVEISRQVGFYWIMLNNIPDLLF